MLPSIPRPRNGSRRCSESAEIATLVHTGASGSRPLGAKSVGAAALVLLVLFSASCARLPERGSAPQPQASQVADPVPRAEPLSRYGNPDSYVVFGKRYYTLKSSRNYTEEGVASWYGKKFHGRRTSSGEIYDMFAMTAAHRTLPLPTYVEVTSLENGSRAVVRVNDRGPFHDDRVLDLSYAAASKLGLAYKGTGRVRLRALEPGAVESDSYRASSEVLRGTRLAHLFVQVGAFSERLNAERVQQRVRVVADAAVGISTASKEGQDLFRVRIGPFGRIEDADRVVGQLTTLGLPGGHVVVEGATSGSLASDE